MIHIRRPILTTLLIMRMKAVEPPGGCHGTDNKAYKYPMGAVGSSANEHDIGRFLSQLHDYFDVCRGLVQSLDLRRSGCCTDTVARVRRLYREGGVKALHRSIRQAVQVGPVRNISTK